MFSLGLLVFEIDGFSGLVLPAVDLHHLEADPDDVDDGHDDGENPENEPEAGSLGLPGLEGGRGAEENGGGLGPLVPQTDSPQHRR